MKLLVTIIIILCSSYTVADTLSEVREYRTKKEREILQEFVALLAIPNVASDEKNIRLNASYIQEMMKKRAIATRA